VELVDAKNHWYTINKNVQRLMAAGDTLTVKHLAATTHNIFDFSEPTDFRRETLLGIVTAARDICARVGAQLVPATMGEIAADFRTRTPRPARGEHLRLDERGRVGWAQLSAETDDPAANAG
jgi:hypothetical protein